LAQDLAKILGIEVNKVQIRTRGDGEVSIIDAICLLTGMEPHDAAQTLRNLRNFNPVGSRISHCQFPGERQRPTPVTDLSTLYEILMLLPGKRAAECRRKAAQLMIRYLGGDMSLIQEVEKMHHIQQRLAEEAPDHPLRAFGREVEADQSSGSEEPEIVHPEPEEVDPKGDYLYGMRVPGELGVLKVGRTIDVGRRERELSSGLVQTFRTVIIFVGAGPIEKNVHKILRDQQVSNEIFRVNAEELKEAVKAARLEYKREQNLMTLRPPSEEQPPNKRRRLAEDLDLEERQIALEHQKAKNALEIKERNQDLREREATFNQNLREREARFVMEMEERKLSLREREAQINKQLAE
jgi:hypothetical protein